MTSIAFSTRLAVAVAALMLAAACAHGAEAADGLAVARTALTDGFYELAEQQARESLAAGAEAAVDQTREALALLAAALYRQGKYEDILKELDPALSPWMKRAGDAALLTYWRAFALYGLARSEDALRLLSALDLGAMPAGDAGRVLRLRGWCHLARGEKSAALTDFALYDRDFPDGSEAADNLLDWGKELIASGRPAEAQPVLDRLAARADGGSAQREGRYWLARTLLPTGDVKRAESLLQAVGQDAETAPDLKAMAWYALADAYVATNDTEDAVDALTRGMSAANSKDLKRSGGYRLGNVLLAAGRVAEAVPLLKAFVAESPQDPAAGATQLRLAGALLDHDQAGPAVEEFQHYLETFTNATGMAEAHRGKGWGLMGVGRFAEAASEFSKAHDMLESPADKERCLFKVGDAYFANGQYKLAADAYQRLLREFPDAALIPNALFQLGECHARAGDNAEAAETLRQLVDRFPSNALLEEALLRIADIREVQGLWVEAIDGYARVVNVSSNGLYRAYALHGRGTVLFRLFRFEEALKDFERVTTEFPDSPVAEQAFYERGMCYFGLGRDEQAAAVCDAFLQRYPDSQWAPEVLFWLGKEKFNRGNYEAAEADLLRFVERYPSHALSDDAMLWAGRAAFKRKEYVRAKDLLARFAKDYPLSPKMPEARFTQAEALSQMGAYAAAILIFDEIINKYPDSDLVPAAWGKKGDCQFTLGAEDPPRYAESLESYRVVSASTLATLDLAMQADYKIGRCLEKMDKPSEALDQYYRRVIMRFFEDREKGVRQNESCKVWFTRAALNAADMLEARQDWRRLVSVLQKLVAADVPGMLLEPGPRTSQ